MLGDKFYTIIFDVLVVQTLIFFMKTTHYLIVKENVEQQIKNIYRFTSESRCRLFSKNFKATKYFRETSTNSIKNFFKTKENAMLFHNLVGE